MAQAGTTEGFRRVLRALGMVLIVDSLVLYLVVGKLKTELPPNRDSSGAAERLGQMQSECILLGLTGLAETAASFLVRER